MDQYQKFIAAMTGFESALPNFSCARFIVALSGGADSTVLLHFLCKHLNDSSRITAAHVNHMIRGEEANHDENFCKKLAAQLGVKIITAKLDVPAEVRRSGRSTEEVAREMRYSFLSKTALEIGGENVYVLTAHNADDNLETVLLNLTRGTGLRGLCGIPPIRGIFLRPLLTISSDQIRSYADENKIDYVIDSTNLSTQYTRNKIRHLVIPTLREINPAVCLASVETSENLRADNAYIESAAATITQNFAEDTGISVSALNDLPSPVFARAVIEMYEKVSFCTHLEKSHIRALRGLCQKAEESSSISLPGGISAYINKSNLIFKHTAEEEGEYSIELSLPGKVSTKYFEIEAEIGNFSSKETPYDENIYKLSIHTSVSSAKIVGRVFVRNRKDGDTVRIGNMTRKVKKLLSEKHVPLHVRHRYPIIEDEAGILWIPGFPPRDASASTGDDAVTLICKTKVLF